MSPAIASSISASVGCGLLASSAAADMIWPDWQYPHLRDLAVEPGLLDLGARRCRSDRLDGCDLKRADALDRCDAGAGGLTAEMHRARATQRHAAAALRTCHA